MLDPTWRRSGGPSAAGGKGCSREHQPGSGAALGSALCVAVSTVLQQRGASRAPHGSGLHLGLLADLMGRPLWLGGLLAGVGTVALQAVATVNLLRMTVGWWFVGQMT